ncbi:MAG: histone deacetylase family protein [Candidatus Latescibacterota bacterium]
MRIVASSSHRRHAPATEFTGEGLLPYPETPDRVDAILTSLRQAGQHPVLPPRELRPAELTAVHELGYLEYLQQAYPAWIAAGLPAAGVVGSVYATGSGCRAPASVVLQAGSWAGDTTPIVEGTWQAALSSAACAVTAAEAVRDGQDRTAYAICRPPGHHAGRASLAGYCYLNNAAMAASTLTSLGRVAVIDLDFHHGNGTQEIFYGSDQVLFVSLHGDPDRQYPLYTGRADEKGTGPGLGYNRNLPLPAGTADPEYLATLDLALDLVAGFRPAALVVSAGMDTCAGDPLGDFALSPACFPRIGERLAWLGLPLVVVQEGGYRLDLLGPAVAGLVTGLGDEPRGWS